MPNKPAALDHLILLVPDLNHLPTPLSTFFTLTPGGSHADGLTANTLIPLASGTYIELIAFTSSTTAAQRAAHWWGTKPEGSWADWCLEGHPAAPISAQADTNTDAVTDTVTVTDKPTPSNALYLPGQRGGRTSPAGDAIEWVVTFPRRDRYAQGTVPFWCADYTPRALRVPGSREQVAHASGAVAVGELRVVVAEEQRAMEFAEIYARILGVGGDGGGLGRNGGSAGNVGNRGVREDGSSYVVALSHPGECDLGVHVKVCVAQPGWQRERAKHNGGAVLVGITLWNDTKNAKIDHESGSDVKPIEIQSSDGGNITIDFKSIKLI